MKWLASIGLSGTVLALFAAITSVAIGWTYLGTKAQIDLEVRRAEARQLLEIFPPDTHDNEIVDDVFDSGRSVKAIVDAIKVLSRRNAPEVIRTATVYYKPSMAKVDIVPDFFIHETDKWLVFPHEIDGLTVEEISHSKPLVLGK